jgi:hypothetical protein
MAFRISQTTLAQAPGRVIASPTGRNPMDWKNGINVFMIHKITFSWNEKTSIEDSRN